MLKAFKFHVEFVFTYNGIEFTDRLNQHKNKPTLFELELVKQYI